MSPGREVRTAALVTHSNAADTAPGFAAAREAANAVGCELIIPRTEANKHGAGAEGLTVVESLPREVDLCLALGGDGTILRSLRHFSGTEVPVFGVNYGTVGFLAATERSTLDEGLRRAFAGEFEILQLPGLEATLQEGTRLALNDVSFTRRPHHRVPELSYRLGNNEVGNVRCDGLVAATPVGSTGYNLANGGPILAWGVAGYVVSFIAPHTLTTRPLVVAPDDVLHVHNLGDRDPVDVAMDGVPHGGLEPRSEIEIRFRDNRGRLAQLEGQNFYRRIREKFGQFVQ